MTLPNKKSKKEIHYNLNLIRQHIASRNHKGLMAEVTPEAMKWVEEARYVLTKDAIDPLKVHLFDKLEAIVSVHALNMRAYPTSFKKFEKKIEKEIEQAGVGFLEKIEAVIDVHALNLLAYPLEINAELGTAGRFGLPGPRPHVLPKVGGRVPDPQLVALGRNPWNVRSAVDHLREQEPAVRGEAPKEGNFWNMRQKQTAREKSRIGTRKPRGPAGRGGERRKKPGPAGRDGGKSSMNPRLTGKRGPRSPPRKK